MASVKTTPAKSRGFKPYLSVLARRNFGFLWLGQAISWFGDSLYFISLLWLVQEMTGSKAMMGVVAVCRTVPALFSFATGALVDAVDKKKSMIVVSLAQALVVGLIPVMRSQGILQAWHIPVAAFLLSSLGAFMYPARQALLPQLVPQQELVYANSLMTMAQQIVFIGGYAAGGLLIAALGVMPLFGIDSVSFVAVAAAVWFLNLPARAAGDEPAGSPVLPAAPPSESAGRRFATDLREGWGFMIKTPAIMMVMPLSIIINFIFAPLGVLMPSWVKDVLQKGPEVFGFLETAVMVGTIAGSMVAGLMVARFRTVVVVSLVSMGLALAAFAASREVWLSLMILVFFGLANAICNVMFMSYLQAITPQNIIGRVFGACQTLTMMAAPAGQALAGVLGQTMPLPLLFGGPGYITAVLSVVYFAVPAVGRALDSASRVLSAQAEPAQDS